MKKTSQQGRGEQEDVRPTEDSKPTASSRRTSLKVIKTNRFCSLVTIVRQPSRRVHQACHKDTSNLRNISSCRSWWEDMEEDFVSKDNGVGQLSDRKQDACLVAYLMLWKHTLEKSKTSAINGLLHISCCGNCTVSYSQDMNRAASLVILNISQDFSFAKKKSKCFQTQFAGEKKYEAS